MDEYNPSQVRVYDPVVQHSGSTGQAEGGTGDTVNMGLRLVGLSV